jgi:hypothetical protein
MHYPIQYRKNRMANAFRPRRDRLIVTSLSASSTAGGINRKCIH